MGHERAMFWMFWTHLQHQNTLTKHIEAFLVFFQKLVVKISHFSIKYDKETHVNQNRVCRFTCVCRTGTRQRAFESPCSGECFKYPHYGCYSPRNFFTGP